MMRVRSKQKHHRSSVERRRAWRAHRDEDGVTSALHALHHLDVASGSSGLKHRILVEKEGAWFLKLALRPVLQPEGCQVRLGWQETPPLQAKRASIPCRRTERIDVQKGARAGTAHKPVARTARSGNKTKQVVHKHRWDGKVVEERAALALKRTLHEVARAVGHVCVGVIQESAEREFLVWMFRQLEYHIAVMASQRLC